MVFGLSIFGVFVAPLIALIAWGISIIRLRSWVLLGATVLLLIIVLATSFNAIFVVVRNPYVMLLLMGLAIFNVMVLSYANNRDKRYIIAADGVLLAMMAALHLWSVYLRQSELYFYEQSNYGSLSYVIIMSLLSLTLPILAFVARLSRKNSFRWGIFCVIGSIVAALTLGLLLSQN